MWNMAAVSLRILPVVNFSHCAVDDDRMNAAVAKMRNCGMWNAEGKMRNGNCGRWCGTVGKMCNAEICLCGRSFVHGEYS